MENPIRWAVNPKTGQRAFLDPGTNTWVVDTQIDSGINSGIGTNTKTSIDPQIDSNTDPKIDSNIDPKISPKPGFPGALKAGGESFKNLLPAVRTGFSKLTGDVEGATRHAQEFLINQRAIEESLKGATDWRDIGKIWGDSGDPEDSVINKISKTGQAAFDYTQELVGLNTPHMAAIMSAGFMGSTATGVVPALRGVSPVVGAVLGSSLASLPIFTGFNVSRQIQESNRDSDDSESGVSLSKVDLPKATMWAGFQTAAELLFLRALGIGGRGVQGTSILGREIPDDLLKRMANQAGEAMLVGVPVEIVQQAAERASADISVSSPEALEEYLDAAIGAAVLGGGLGALSGIPKNTSEADRKILENRFKEEVVGTMPVSDIVSDVKDAETILEQQGFKDPRTLFEGNEEYIKRAANVVIDRVDVSRFDWFNKMDMGLDQESNIFNILNPKTDSGIDTGIGSKTDSGIKTNFKSLLATTINTNLDPLTKDALNQVKSQKDIKDLGTGIRIFNEAQARKREQTREYSLKGFSKVTGTRNKYLGEILKQQRHIEGLRRGEDFTSDPVTFMRLGTGEDSVFSLGTTDSGVAELKSKMTKRLLGRTGNTQQHLAEIARGFRIPERLITNEGRGLRPREAIVRAMVEAKFAQNARTKIQNQKDSNSEIDPGFRTNPFNTILDSENVNTAKPVSDIASAVEEISPGAFNKALRRILRDSKTDSGIDPKIDSKINPGIDSNIKTKIDQNIKDLDQHQKASMLNLFSLASDIKTLPKDVSTVLGKIEPKALEFWYTFSDPNNTFLTKKDRFGLNLKQQDFSKYLKNTIGIGESDLAMFIDSPSLKDEGLALGFQQFLEHKIQGKVAPSVEANLPPEHRKVFQKALDLLMKVDTKIDTDIDLGIGSDIDSRSGRIVDALRRIRLSKGSDEIQIRVQDENVQRTLNDLNMVETKDQSRPRRLSDKHIRTESNRFILGRDAIKKIDSGEGFRVSPDPTLDLKNTRVSSDSKLGGLLQLSQAQNLASKFKSIGGYYGIVDAKRNKAAWTLQDIIDKGANVFKSGDFAIQKTHEVLDHLKNTNQDYTKNSEGHVTFVRDGNIVVISDPKAVQLLDETHAFYKNVLNHYVSRMLQDAYIALEIPDSNTNPSIPNMNIGTDPGNISDIAGIKNIKTHLERLQAVLDSKIKEESIPGETRDYVVDLMNKLGLGMRLGEGGKVYVPRMRFWDYGVAVYNRSDINPKTGRPLSDKDPVYVGGIEKGWFDKKYNQDHLDKVEKDIKEYRTSPSKYWVSDVFEIKQGYVDDRLLNNLMNTVDSLAGLMNGRDLDAYQGMMDRITRAHQSRQSVPFVESRNIPGYSNDWSRVMRSYATGASYTLAKSEFDPHLNRYVNMAKQELTGPSGIDEYKWLEKYHNYILSPSNDWREVRGISYLWALGGQLSTAFLQVFTLPTTTLGSMTSYNLNPVKNIGILSKYTTLFMQSLPRISDLEAGSVTFDVTSDKARDYLLNKKKIDPRVYNSLVKASRLGKLGAPFHTDIGGSVGSDSTLSTRGSQDRYSNVQEGLRVFTNIFGAPVSLMEQITRVSTLASHLDMLYKDPESVKRGDGILKDDARYQAQKKFQPDLSIQEHLALFGMDEAHAVFGKEGRGTLLRGGMGAFVFPFMTYPLNAIEYMGRLWGRGREGKIALGSYLFGLMLFSGLSGMPGAELFKELFDKFMTSVKGIQFDSEMLIREHMYNTTGERASGIFMYHGALRMMGMDMSKRIGLELPGENIATRLLKDQSSPVSDFGGVPGSMAVNALNAWKAYSQGYPAETTLSFLTPVSVSNLFKAIQMSNEGLISQSGLGRRELISQEEIQENPGIAWMRAFGITHSTVTDARDSERIRMSENLKTRPFMDKMRTKGTRIIKEYLRESSRGNVESSKSAMDAYEELLNEVFEYHSDNEIIFDIRAFNRSIFQSGVQSGVGWKDLNRASRFSGVLDKIENLTKD